MKLGIHSMVWVGDWSPASARHAIESSARAGYDLIELAAINPAEFDVDLTNRLLADNGLEASVSLGLDAATDISSEDDDVVAAGHRRLREALALVRDTGGDFLCGVIYSALRKYEAPATERGRENSRRTLAELADEAADSGITLCLEFCNRYETNIINTTQETLDLIATIGRPNVHAHLDTYHMNIEEADMREPVLAAARAGKLGYVHVGESNRGPLGAGTIPWDDFWGALREAEYDGVVTFESFSSRVVHPLFSNSLAIWRTTWDDNVALAADAIAFMRKGLARP